MSLAGGTDFLTSVIDSQKLEITDMICDLGKIFDDIKILPRGSSSSSIQSLATIKTSATYPVLKEYLKKSPLIFLKTVFSVKGDNSDLVEKTIYKYLTKLVIQHRTPNFMRFVAAFKCENYINMFFELDIIDSTQASVFEDNAEDIGDVYDITNEVIVLILERGMGNSLRDILKKYKPDENEFINIMFQVFYTLREMYMAKVRHNDLHLGNIWIDVLPSKRRLIYFVTDNEYAIIETKYLVKIYDFDRSTFTDGNLTNTSLNDFCPDYGMCANDNPYFDVHTIVYYLNYEFAGKSYIHPFVKEVIRNDKYLDQDCCTFPGRMCKKVPGLPDNPERCSKTFVPTYGDIYDFTDLWNKTDVFKSLKNTLTQNGFDKKDIPISKTIFYNSIPENVFDANPYVYFSQVCSFSPALMANKLYTDYK